MMSIERTAEIPRILTVVARLFVRLPETSAILR
jgi:hypothetical protein